MTTKASQHQLIFGIIFPVFLLGMFLAVPILASAQTGGSAPLTERSYYYESISEKFTVNKDTSVDVEETQVYNFTGEYHKGWRSISLNKVSDITDVSILEGGTLQPLQYVSNSLEKTDPNSWGKYTYRKNGGNLEIEWYYNAQDTTRSWILKYKLIGAVSFLSKTKDELYWNLLTDYDVPVKKVMATVNVLLQCTGATDCEPQEVNPADFPAKIYMSGAENEKAEVSKYGDFSFSAENVAPHGMVTIAAGWPTGIVDRNAYWWQFLKVHYASILSVLIILLTILSMILYWYFTEVRGKGRGTIIPEYEPPQHLPPAMAEALVKEGITGRAWPATIVDLAVRGYLNITEEDAGILPRIGRFFAIAIPAVFFFVLLFMWKDTGSYVPLFVLVFFVLVIFRVVFSGTRAKDFFSPKEYVLAKKREYKDDPGLKDYERTFLSIILSVNDRFSTKEVKKSATRRQALYIALKSVEADVYEETDTKAYDVGISKEKNRATILVVLILAIFGGFKLFDRGVISSELTILGIVTGICIAGLYAYIKFEARLSASGAILREEWLGFKLYLETAERDRLQNLTPEIFEKYLPYAIIFGVEKKWGKAFEGISMAPPNWYHGAYVGGIAGSSGNTSGFSSGFSAGAFSASFASSFSSAFASSGGGGGASGGGGGAGGGGGGGGGGAS